MQGQIWTWQHSDWPDFYYDVPGLMGRDEAFLRGLGGQDVLFAHLPKEDQFACIEEVLTLEGETSSRIEGEVLQRDSLRSSIRRHFGLASSGKSNGTRESGMADLLCLVYETYDKPLTHDMLWHWHKTLMNGFSDLREVGEYRSHSEPMQIVSGQYGDYRVQYEAPPSDRIPDEMDRFLQVFNSDREERSLLGQTALLHSYFESIHPFEDGNGRIGRVLVEKYLSMQVGHPVLLAISRTIEQRRKHYYKALGSSNHTLDISRWVDFFSAAAVEAQGAAREMVEFVVAKGHFMQKLSGDLNPRQEKVLIRMFAEGPSGFRGGLSAENYLAITKTSRATATRDLSDLVTKGALLREGVLRHTRYHLNLG